MFPAPFPALLDANVLYPFTLRDTLLRCAESDLYQPYWSAEILDEATRNLVRNGVMSESKAKRLTAQMTSAFPEAMVEGHEELIPAMRNHPKDCHVAAAAVKAGARVIVTFNLSDFENLPDGFEAQSPDEFLCHLYDLDPSMMIEIIRQQAGDLENPPRTVEEVATALAKSVPEFGAILLARLSASE
jgi:predicted nucleic acid-binding protein